MKLSNGSNHKEELTVHPEIYSKPLNAHEIRGAYDGKDMLVEQTMVTSMANETIAETFLPSKESGEDFKLVHGGLPNAQIYSNKTCFIVRRGKNIRS